MPDFSLVPYVIQIKESHKSKEGTTYSSLPLGTPLKDLGTNFLGLLEAYLTSELPVYQNGQVLKNGVVLVQDLNILSASDIKDTSFLALEEFSRDNITISGRFRFGSYGYGHPLFDVETGNVDDRKKSHIDLIPYYFKIKLPSQVKWGILILQTFRGASIKESFFRGFNQFVKHKSKHRYSLELSPLVPKEIVKLYMSQRILEVRFVKFGYPKGKIDVNIDDLPDEEQGEFELVYKAPKGRHFPQQFLDWLNGGVTSFLSTEGSSVSNLLVVKDFDFQNVKIKVALGKGERTVDLSDQEKIKYSKVLDGEVEIDPVSGYPKFNSTDDLASSFLLECTEIWGGDKDA
jgi:hypothetical protein